MNDEQAKALQDLSSALLAATMCGLLDDLATEVSPDVINQFCDAAAAAKNDWPTESAL